jgi:predicted DNA-binding transcriptional regulator AlpA
LIPLLIRALTVIVQGLSLFSLATMNYLRLAPIRSLPASLGRSAKAPTRAISPLSLRLGCPQRSRHYTSFRSLSTSGSASSTSEKTANTARRNYKLPLAVAVLLVGLSLTLPSIYTHFSSLFAFPRPVRLSLRRALRAKYRGELDESASAFREALSLAESLDGGDDEAARARRTGIAIALAGILEESGKLDEAWRAYRGAMVELRGAPTERELTVAGIDGTAEPGNKTRSERERLRAAGVAQKLGGIAERTRETGHEAEAREAMEWALAELLKLSGKTASGEEESPLAGDDLQLPSWLTRTDLGASMENLASSYARTGKPESVCPI